MFPIGWQSRYDYIHAASQLIISIDKQLENTARYKELDKFNMHMILDFLCKGRGLNIPYTCDAMLNKNLSIYT